MADAARRAKADLWEPAGIVPGARVAAAGLANVAVREGRAEETGLEAGSLDVVMLWHVLAHNGGGEDAIVAHLATLLRPGGCLYLVDLQERYLAIGRRSRIQAQKSLRRSDSMPRSSS